MSGFNEESMIKQKASLFLPKVIENIHGRLLTDYIMRLNDSHIKERVFSSLWLKMRNQAIKHISARVMPRIDVD
jgi:hypothetical protein